MSKLKYLPRLIEYKLSMRVNIFFNQESTCGICGKRFSGQRYLTMHMKSVHQTGAKHEYKVILS